MKVIVILNEGSGDSGKDAETDLVKEIRAAFDQAGLDAKLVNAEGPNLIKETKTALAARPDAIVAAGGDGTVSAVASVLAGTDMPMGVLPLGTLNHFAKDLTIPLEIADAVQVIRQQQTLAVDIGRLNAHTFVNNSSLGVYPWVVKKREEDASDSHLGKNMSMLWACVHCMYQFPLSRVYLTVDDARKYEIKTPFIFIGNNEYHVNPSGFGDRHELNAGTLCVYTVRHDGRLGLLRLLCRILLGKLHEEGTFERHLASKFQIDSEESELSVAMDGEVMDVKTPLLYTTAPGDLKVIVP